ncbi:hypothetical protein Rcae01_03869 [Novipirellula caenicola]|uniref:Uncharacterized protein n=1 Tax=Novipirellula caenicola TaxID=1536901 RepID=A0ABP9VXU0_9BACT
MDFLVRQWRIRRTRKSIVRIKQQAVDDFRYGRKCTMAGLRLGWRTGQGESFLRASTTVTSPPTKSGGEVEHALKVLLG